MAGKILNIVVVALILLILLVSFVAISSEFTDFIFSKKYSIYLNGEKLSEINVCSNEWHYENIGFIPCVNGTDTGAFVQGKINWTLSPEDNCEIINYTFVGYNIKNKTRSEEIYNSLLPDCYVIKDYQITESWLQSEDCINTNDGYDCGGGLFIK